MAHQCIYTDFMHIHTNTHTIYTSNILQIPILPTYNRDDLALLTMKLNTPTHPHHPPSLCPCVPPSP